MDLRCLQEGLGPLPKSIQRTASDVAHSLDLGGHRLGLGPDHSLEDVSLVPETLGKRASRFPGAQHDIRGIHWGKPRELWEKALYLLRQGVAR